MVSTARTYSIQFEFWSPQLHQHLCLHSTCQLNNMYNKMYVKQIMPIPSRNQLMDEKTKKNTYNCKKCLQKRNWCNIICIVKNVKSETINKAELLSIANRRREIVNWLDNAISNTDNDNKDSRQSAFASGYKLSKYHCSRDCTTQRQHLQPLSKLSNKYSPKSFGKSALLRLTAENALA